MTDRSRNRWLTGRDVKTNDPSITPPEKQSFEAEGAEDAPNKSDNKDVWIDYRKDQGYTDEQLDGLNKDQVMELPDDPADFEEE